MEKRVGIEPCVSWMWALRSGSSPSSISYNITYVRATERESNRASASTAPPPHPLGILEISKPIKQMEEWNIHIKVWMRNVTVTTTPYFDVCWTVHHCDNWRIKNQIDATYYSIVLLIRLNMFRASLCPSSGARDYNVDYHVGRFVLGLL